MPLKLEVQKTIANMIVHWVQGSEVLASSRYDVFVSQDEGMTFTRTSSLGTSKLTGILSKSRFFYRGLRLGIRDLRKLRSGTVLAIADRRIHRLVGNDIKQVYHFRKGVGPLREGWCQDDKGNCYLAEYFLNNERNSAVDVLESVDDGQTWNPVYTFDRIRHVHCVQYDSFTGRIWVATGDREKESKILFSEDKGRTWVTVGSDDQKYRAVSLLFAKQYIYWGSDAPTQQNFIYRQERKSGTIERLVAVNGPVHYSSMLQNGIMLFGTTAEGNSEGKSAAWDDKAHIWASEDGTTWTDAASWDKDIFPYVLGLGRIYFPHGYRFDKLYFTTEALKGVDNTTFIAKLITKE